MSGRFNAGHDIAHIGQDYFFSLISPLNFLLSIYMSIRHLSACIYVYTDTSVSQLLLTISFTSCC